MYLATIIKSCQIIGWKVMGNFMIEGSGWHHLNPPINLIITKDGTAKYYAYHDVMYSYKVQPNTLESAPNWAFGSLYQCTRNPEDRERNQTIPWEAISQAENVWLPSGQIIWFFHQINVIKKRGGEGEQPTYPSMDE